MKLENRTALITGAGRGIGRSIALAFASEGAAIVAVARNGLELKETCSEINRLGGQSLSLECDLSDFAVPQLIVRDAIEQFGHIDILVNNAGVGSGSPPRPVMDFEDGFWHYTLDINLSAPYYACKAVLPGMLERRYGRIINIASVAGKIGLMHGAAYSASKHGLLGLTKSLALEVAPDGITVNAICPGPVRTSMSDNRVRYDAVRRGVTIENLESTITPIGRRLLPQEIAPLAVLLASEESAAITGQAFNVCGGAAM